MYVEMHISGLLVWISHILSPFYPVAEDTLLEIRIEVPRDIKKYSVLPPPCITVALQNNNNFTCNIR